ncbi:hypothetical protein LTR08_004628 [Meristemomyces frigidus]|nr:hypothetical protein LTR08_004628 [Meristemomyces frigidus]
MADVRSMLRAERASRRITHPNASYTSDGKLSCNLCETLVKTEAAWQGHLHSTGHTLRLGRAQDAAAMRGTDTGKKRKASDLASPTAEDRKKAKPAGLEGSVGLPVDVVDENRNDTPAILLPTPAEHPPTVTNETEPDAPPADSVDDAELANFERELAEMEASEQSATVLSAGATITAAPMSAEELAAQAREELSAQRGHRDAEIEDERADATRLLEDEFEEMEGLEKRVRMLRERREALRKVGGDADRVEDAAVLVEPVINGNAVAGERAEADDDDEDEDVDEWGFGSR